MSRSSAAASSLPAQAVLSLRKLGENLRTARKRRNQSLQAWAARMQVSIPTLSKMESGDPTVGIGVYATAIWLAGGLPALADVASPASDLAALEAEVRQANLRGKTRERLNG